jgi:hypothetical protein
MNNKLLYRIPEVAEHLSISRSKVYELLKSGELRSVRTHLAPVALMPVLPSAYATPASRCGRRPSGVADSEWWHAC